MAGEMSSVVTSLEEEKQREHGAIAGRELGETARNRPSQRLQRRLQIAQQQLQALEERLRRRRSQGRRCPQRPQGSRKGEQHSVGEESSQVLRRGKALHQPQFRLRGRNVHEMIREASDRMEGDVRRIERPVAGSSSLETHDATRPENQEARLLVVREHPVHSRKHVRASVGSQLARLLLQTTHVQNGVLASERHTHALLEARLHGVVTHKRHQRLSLQRQEAAPDDPQVAHAHLFPRRRKHRRDTQSLLRNADEDAQTRRGHRTDQRFRSECAREKPHAAKLQLGGASRLSTAREEPATRRKRDLRQRGDDEVLDVVERDKRGLWVKARWRTNRRLRGGRA